MIHVINEEVLQRVNEERNILHTINRGNANRIGHIFCRNCVLKHATENRRKDKKNDGKTRKKT
jgi:hypothetical protein